MQEDVAVHIDGVRDLSAGCHYRARVHAFAGVVRFFGVGSFASPNWHQETGSLAPKISRISGIPWPNMHFGEVSDQPF